MPIRAALSWKTGQWKEETNPQALAHMISTLLSSEKHTIAHTQTHTHRHTHTHTGTETAGSDKRDFLYSSPHTEENEAAHVRVFVSLHYLLPPGAGVKAQLRMKGRRREDEGSRSRKGIGRRRGEYLQCVPPPPPPPASHSPGAVTQQQLLLPLSWEPQSLSYEAAFKPTATNNCHHSVHRFPASRHGWGSLDSPPPHPSPHSVRLDQYRRWYTQ